MSNEIIIPYKPDFVGKVHLPYEWGEELLKKEYSTKQQLKMLRTVSENLIALIPKKHVLMAKTYDTLTKDISEFIASQKEENRDYVLSACLFLKWKKTCTIGISIIDKCANFEKEVSKTNGTNTKISEIEKLRAQSDEIYYSTVNQLLSFSNMPENKKIGLLSKDFAFLIQDYMPITEQIQSVLNAKILEMSDFEKEVGKKIVVPFEDYYIEVTFAEKGQQVGFYSDKECTIPKLNTYYK